MYTPPITLTLTDETGVTETYTLRNGKYVGQNSGREFVAELFPAASPESVDTLQADFQTGQIPANWFSQWSSTQTFLTIPKIAQAINFAIAKRTGGYIQGGLYSIPPH